MSYISRRQFNGSTHRIFLAMLSARRLLALARKWRKMAASGRKRIHWMNREAYPDQFGGEDVATNKTIAAKGHFMVCSCEGQRFMVPLEFLNCWVFRELLMLSEEEFGFSGDGPLCLPCDAVFLRHVLLLLRGRRGSRDAEREMVMSGFRQHCSISDPRSADSVRQLAAY
ncbi:auxin-responsive protein SAUR64-like [Zingiber officinale]|nr:auxin-responsive protein SAUR64-like [Zingiber officinale]